MFKDPGDRAIHGKVNLDIKNARGTANSAAAQLTFKTVVANSNNIVAASNTGSFSVIPGPRIAILANTANNGISFNFIPSRTSTTANSAAPTPNSDTDDQYTVTALAIAAVVGSPGGSPTDGQKLVIRIKDNGTARALTWNAIYRAGTDVALPTTTVLSKTLYCGFAYNSADSKWDLLAVVNNI